MTQAIETKFNFKARKIVDDQGKELGRTKKQPSLTVSIPVPSPEELVAKLSLVDTQNDKGEAVVDKTKALILEAISDLIRDQAKSQLDDVIDSFGNDDTKTVTAEAIDYDKLTLEYIANLPPAQRGARAISEEDFEAFFTDYLAVMVTVTGKTEEKILNHIGHFKKPTRVKQNKEALGILVDQLDVYLASSQNVEDTGEVANRIRSKFDKWAKEDDKFDVTAL